MISSVLWHLCFILSIRKHPLQSVSIAADVYMCRYLRFCSIPFGNRQVGNDRAYKRSYNSFAVDYAYHYIAAAAHIKSPKPSPVFSACIV